MDVWWGAGVGPKQDRLKTHKLFNPAKKGLRERTVSSEGEVQRTVSVSNRKQKWTRGTPVTLDPEAFKARRRRESLTPQ